MSYLPVPALESPAYSGSFSSSSSSRSSWSLFDVDPQASDSQTDASPPQTPEKAVSGDGSVPMPRHLKFMPDYDSRLGLDATPKQRLFMQRSDRPNKDMGYNSERESCFITARKDRAKVLTRKRGVPSRFRGLEATRSQCSEANLDPPRLDMADNVFSLDACDSSVGSRTTDSACQSPRLREEVIGLGLDLGPLGLFRGTSISIGNSMEAASPARRSECPLKPRLVPILDAASPSPIVSLPSPVMVLGEGTTSLLIWSTTLPHQMAPQWPPRLGVKEWKTSLTSSVLELPAVRDPLLAEVSTDVTNQENALQSVSGNTDGPLVGVGLGMRRSLPELQISDSGTQKIEQTFSPVMNLGPGGPVSQAIVFASIPFFSAQPRRKKSANGLGLGHPAALGHCPQMERTSRLAYFPRLPSCVKRKVTPRCIPIITSPSPPLSPCSPSHRRIVAGGRHLLKPHNFLNRCLYAIPEVVSPTCCPPTGRSPCVTKLPSEAEERQEPMKQDGSTCMTSHPLPSEAGIRGRLPRSEALRPGVTQPRGYPKSPKSLNHDTPRRSPVIIRLEVPQKLRFVKRRPGTKAWSGLCSLF